MKRWIAGSVLGVVAITVSCASPEGPSAPQAVDESAASRGQAGIYLVTFRDDVTDVRGTTGSMAAMNGLAVRAVREHAARGFSAMMSDQIAERLRNDPRVAIVEPDGPVSLIVPRVAARPGSGGGQTTPWGITRVGGAGDGTGKTAWIIDTGIDLDHSDLNTSRNCHANFVARGKNSPDDGNGHGTHVAGTVAAINNSIDVVGVAANAYVCAVRVLDNSGSGTWEGVVNGVNYVAANGSSGEVANMSLGGSGSNATLEKAVQDAAATGVKFSLAAGNNGDDANNFTPARVNGTNVYTISAFDSNDCMASFSNYGNPPIDYSAPGVSVLSTRKGGGTTTFSGTSMAAPHAAGVLLLGAPNTDGNISCDKDSNPDPIIHR